MENVGQRHNRRLKVAIRAIVSDYEQQNSIRCMIHDGSISGCKIVSRKVFDLPDDVLINIASLDQLIKGRIVWRNHHMAGIEFKWKTTLPNEKRNATRQEMSLPAIIADYSYNKIADCIICDASRTGCRITSEAISEIPDDILIEIPGLSEPVLALIVWRNSNMAGLMFVWASEVYILDDSQKV